MRTKLRYLFLATTMAIAPVSQASAHDHWHHDGPIIGLAALGVAAVVGTAAILTAPVRAVEAPVAYYPPQPVYPPAPAVYYAPPPVYYAAAPVYYGPGGYYYGR